jgi:replicative DNA helicase
MVQEPSRDKEFKSFNDRLPPQNMDAEEAILGGILMDPEAISRITDILRPEAFYLSAHRQMYEAALALHLQGKPTDLMNLVTYLQDKDQLEKIGGQGKLADLFDRTPSAVNIDQYAMLVMEKYLRRRLIRTGQEISELGHDTSQDFEEVLNTAEQKVFNITQTRPQDGLVSTADVLTQTFSDIESRSVGLSVPGLACGFYDLDAMTQGFQRSDLIIVAGRPAMGKCLAADAEILLSDGSLKTIEAIYHSQNDPELLTLGDDFKLRLTKPTVYVDDGIKPLFQVTTRLGRQIATTLTHPYRTIRGWQPLEQLTVGDRIAVPRRIPIMGTEQIRDCEVKRLATSVSDGDEQTIPDIVFRLARSPLALFLNRLFATDGWATVLASGQSQLGYCSVSETLARQLQHLLLRFGVVAALKSRSVKYKETRRPAWQLDITDACSIRNFIDEIAIFGKAAAVQQVADAVANRKPHTNRDLVPAGVWDDLTAAKGEESWKSLATRAGLMGTSNMHVGQRSLSRDRLQALATALDNLALKHLASSDVYWDEIVAIEHIGTGQVYDLTIPETHNFVANDVCVHNTSFVLNIARNIASYHKLPVAVFSLEMSKEQLVQRLLSAEVRIESNRLRAGRITAQEWEPLGHSISTLSQMPIFIDDTPSISVPEMRSRLRRLQAEQGGALGLVLVDYLQLMEVKGNDNRVQALSSITRGLKALARELSVPVIALSQLSRGVESRTEKRPMMSDLRECVTGDTLVMLADGRRVPIQELVGQTPNVLTMTPDEKITIAQSDKVWSVGVKPVFEVKLASGRTIKSTAQHRIYAAQGWQELQDLTVGSRVAIARCLPEMATADAWRDEELILLAHLMGDGSYLKGQPLRYTTASEANSQIVTQAAETFGVTVNRHPGKGNWHQLVFSGNGDRWHPKAINLWLRNLGVFNQRSHEKHIPVGVFQQENYKVALFLAHLWSTDGTYHTPKSKTGSRIHLSSCSLQLAQDVAALLLRFEIVARIKTILSEKYRPVYVVEIFGKTMQMAFLDRVGAVACKVDDANRLRNYLAGIKANPNRDTIPQEIFSVIRFQMQEKGITTRQMASMRGTSYGGTSHFKFAPSRDVVLDYAHLLQSKALAQKATSDLFWDEIVSITPIGEAEVFDLTVPGPASWLADGIVSHNSGAIEQDADLIMMLYRDEYYNPDTPDRGIAEVIISKHRNGPVGSVKLLFEPQFTQFRNLAASNRDY